ncbi:type I restriction endonuclease subunit R [Roseivirga sp.]|uniref:type I restriction endonuclease subunit R n=1 Tax=Roseivirga sp. TaxID=1964215 RepID=UPI003B51E485
MAFINETHIEQADIQFFELVLGYEHIDAWEKQLLGRDTLKEVVLREKLELQLKKLNPNLPQECIAHAIEELSKSRASLSPLMANKEVYQLIKEGVPVTYNNAEGRRQDGYVQVIDFKAPENNQFLVVSQFSIEYLQVEGITRRPDLLLFINGLPLVMIELKNATEKTRVGFDKNLKDYRRDIPQLFWYNLFVCISNGIETKVGSFNAEWEHFFAWAKLKDNAEDNHQPSRLELEKESEHSQKRLTLQRFSEGLCNKEALLDYLENFVLYHKNKVKIIAKNHQFLGVNNAVRAFLNREGNLGKLGVFWHTQGSGKSYSMIFFTRKINRRIAGNWSFLIVTDRKDLDDQIYRNFVETETIVVTKAQNDNYYRPGEGKTSGRKQLAEYLNSNRNYVFSMIFKFGIEKGKTYPKITDRNDWIVIIDEAHRTQYKSLADNMRIALPNAQYIAFTGTPLLRNKLTENWFGPYVSEYNFAQSIEDGATVPLFYKKNVPSVKQVNEDLVGDAAEILEEENLTEEQIRRLNQEYSTLLEVVKRDDRLNEIARHIVNHFPYRLDVENERKERKPMKAMVISIDKFTAVRMYDKVKHELLEKRKELRRLIASTSDAELKERHTRALRFIEETDMAVVISQEGSDKEEAEKFRKEGLDITPHRKRLDEPDEEGKNVEDYFKDENHPLRIVFVTSMWLTGFDAPAVSTLYLDKPMQDHTLMQTIARANRVFEAKRNGLVVDYFGVFRNLKKALSVYAEGSKGREEKTEEEFPVKEFEELLDLLNAAIEETQSYCLQHQVNLQAIIDLGDKGFKGIELFDLYTNRLLINDQVKKQFQLYANTIISLYDSAKPEIYDYPLVKKWKDIVEYLKKLVDRSVGNDENLERAKKRVSDLLDTSVLSMGDLQEPEWVFETSKLIDLSKFDFEKLRAEFKSKPYKHTEFEDLKQFMALKLQQMLRQNKTRGGFLERFEEIIEEYNTGSLTIEEAYEQLTSQMETLSEEEGRAAKEGMSETELELFDLLKKPKLTKEEKKRVKLAARQLLERLYDAKARILVLEWHRDKKSREKVKSEIQRVLDANLPESYDRSIFSEKTEVVFQHFYQLAEMGMAFVN